jgi:hypothetical protein
MSEKEISPFSDPLFIPTEEILNEVLVHKYDWFREIIQYVQVNHKQVSDSWRYYNDGKQWLYRMLYRGKTIFWVSVLPDTFRITFYFSSKAESHVLSADLPEAIKKAYLETRGNTFRAISIRMGYKEEVMLACRLIDLKIQSG